MVTRPRWWVLGGALAMAVGCSDDPLEPPEVEYSELLQAYYESVEQFSGADGVGGTAILRVSLFGLRDDGRSVFGLCFWGGLITADCAVHGTLAADELLLELRLEEDTIYDWRPPPLRKGLYGTLLVAGRFAGDGSLRTEVSGQWGDFRGPFLVIPQPVPVTFRRRPWP